MYIHLCVRTINDVIFIVVVIKEKIFSKKGDIFSCIKSIHMQLGRGKNNMQSSAK